MTDETYENSIAIIGISGRFPGANNVREYWDNLCKGVDSISHFSNEELERNGIPIEMLNDSNYIKSKGVLGGIDLFDASFFEINPTEAEVTDPQHRLFLELSWEALEDAGYCPASHSGLIGVYGGAGINYYFLNNIFPNKNLRRKLGDYFIHLANEKDYLTTKVSYKLNLKGPSLNIQTACSTSLVAICEACNDLLTYQCDLALAGGVGISIPEIAGYMYQEGMIFSSDGRCKPFDSQASGTVIGSGGGVVLLKRLEDAQRDRDHIYAIIRGYGVNNDGSRKIGFSAPSIDGQSEAVTSALSMANINPETISYIEAHGTGTILGDPIEIQGLNLAFEEHTQKRQFCAIGSVKSNIGHLMEAAGVAGFIKTAFALQNQLLPPSLHFNAPNPNIDFSNTPFYVNTQLVPWTTDLFPRRACVSSFGIGGTNAHVIIEEPPSRPLTVSKKSSYLLVLSAKTPTALKTMARNLGAYLESNPQISLSDIAYTLQEGRERFDCRKAFIVSDNTEATSSLLDFAKNEPSIGFPGSSSRANVTFVIPRKLLSISVGTGLYQEVPFYRATVDTCLLLLKKLTHIDFQSILYPKSESKEYTSTQMKDLFIEHCISFIITYSLSKLWIELGVLPGNIIDFTPNKLLTSSLSSSVTLEAALQALISQYKPSNDIADEPNLSLSLDKFLNDPNHFFIGIGGNSFLNSSPNNLLRSIDSTDQNDDLAVFLNSLSRLWTSGTTIHWQVLNADGSSQKVSLPTYPFEKKRYWIDIQDQNDISSPLKKANSQIIPSDEIERHLIDLWQDFLGSSVGIYDSFYNLGGDSVLAIQIVSKIHENFGIKLRIQTLLEYPTIAELSNIITEKMQESSLHKNDSYQNIVKFKSNDTGLPLFLIHPIGGHVFCYNSLVANLSYDGPIYGIQSVAPYDTIEDIASFYIKIMQSIQTNGPYNILGSSFGGLVAYEIARQLTESNQTINLLCLIDIMRPGILPLASDIPSMLSTLVELFDRKRSFVNDINKLSLTEKTTMLMNSLGLEKLPFSEQEQIFQVITKHWVALAKYHPKPYSGKILFFEAQDRFTQTEDLSLGTSWKDLVKNRIEIHEIKGNHLTMLMNPNVKEMAAILNNYFAKGLT